MGTSLFTNYEEVVAMLLFGIGFTTHFSTAIY